MKLVIGEDTTVFLINSYIKEIDYKNEKELKKLIKKLNEKYNTRLHGFINATIYKDKMHGVIIELKKEKDYFDYFNKDLSISIKVIEKSFWYKTEDYTLKSKAKKTRKKDSDLYIKPKNIPDIELAQIIENSEVIYKENWRW